MSEEPAHRNQIREQLGSKAVHGCITKTTDRVGARQPTFMFHFYSVKPST